MDSLIEDRLRQEKERLLGLIRSKRKAAEVGIKEMTDELSMYDQHPADLGSEIFEREKDTGILEMLENRLTQVNEALQRLKSGAYGICQFCGNPIDLNRLQRLPSATLCLRCAKKHQDRVGRPVEEEILDMHEIDARGDQFEIAGYDFFDEFGLSESGEND